MIWKKEESMIEEDWEDRAACKGIPPEGDPFLERDNTSMMERFVRMNCHKCEVWKSCWNSANRDDRKYTVRGGRVPGRGFLQEDGSYIGKVRVKSLAKVKAGQVEKGYCNRRLHAVKSKDDLDQYNYCKKCIEEGHTQARGSKTHCAAGHERNEQNIGYRTQDGRPTKFCKPCSNKRRSDRRARERAAKMGA